MVARGVRGLDRFKEHMVGLEDSYAVIGGTACEVLLEDADLEFRATKDIDMVLLVEGRLPEAAAAVWRLVRAGGYSCGWKGSARAHFYRFTEPTDPGFPVMIELFSAAPDFIDEDAGIVVAPMPLDDEVSSLSAILLDEDHYRFMKGRCEIVDGIVGVLAQPPSELLLLFSEKEEDDEAVSEAVGVCELAVRAIGRVIRVGVSEACEA